MRKNAWGMTRGGLFCCGLMAAGMALQLAVGPLRWDALAWPLNGVCLFVLLTGIVLMHLCRRKVRLFRWMATLQAGIPAMLTCAMLTVLMGVTRQVPSGHAPAEPFGITAMLSFWPFVLAYFWLMLLVGMVTLTRLRPRWRNVPFLLNHLGIFIALVAGTLGSADVQTLRMMVAEGKTEWRAVDVRHRVHELPVAIELHDFSIEQEPMPVFKSDVTVYTKSGLVVRDTIRVNKPLAVRGWKIYQYSYEESRPEVGDISVFELVRDPWLPYVYLGIFMMLAGAVALFFGREKDGSQQAEGFDKGHNVSSPVLAHNSQERSELTSDSNSSLTSKT